MCEQGSSVRARIALLEGRKMAPVLGVPPPPPPAPHMGPDGLILPRKPYNPCLISTNHKDLHRELLFNQKIGKNVLNQKSELQRALEKQREAASRREAERIREESYKDDPRTALQRAIEQRARHIQLTILKPEPFHLQNPRKRLFTGAIAVDDGAAEQPPDNSEGEAEAPHRVPVKPVKIEGRATREVMSRPG
ncbi:Uncharacterized protein DBV15_06081 [Temnothorax longispinosus]|uniref:Protein FAM107B n=1 Tax=Temnothorax longispinosus TaxID=300112 RepID=A0A4S2KDH8_9HYME|nr:Uncharacterized protein DBV15_06081 [Temnothorax longispinosus]